MASSLPASVIVEAASASANTIVSAPLPSLQALLPWAFLFAETIACRSVQVAALPASPPSVTVIVAARASAYASVIASASGRTCARNDNPTTGTPVVRSGGREGGYYLGIVQICTGPTAALRRRSRK